MRPRIALLLLGAAACSSAAPSYPSATVFLGSALQPAVAPFFEFWSGPPATLSVAADPVTAAAGAATTTLRVALVSDLGCGDCYQIKSPGTGNYTVHGGSALGVQYGLAQLYEDFGFRFFHPWQSKVPAALTVPASQPDLGQLATPQMALRGIHLHTQHPIEPYFAFWDSSNPDFSDARRILDWTVKNRGNYVEWYGLNSLLGGAPGDAWHTRTAAILAAAHARGLKVGLGIELFGTSNLQQAFDLLDTNGIPDPASVMQERLTLLLTGEPFDTLDMGFGEFTSTDPDYFLSSLNLSYQTLQAVAPGTQMSATVHVGTGPALTVTYQGQQLLYYFLVQFANPAIASWVHTVMYYDLFEPAGGAYGVSDFTDHLDYLEAQIKGAQSPPAYYPESAYWVAFDDSVPTYLPVYVRSRWVDLNGLAALAAQNGTPPLNGHLEFSSGWEWGYWQNDYAALRMSYQLPADRWDMFAQMFTPWGPVGTFLARDIQQLADLQDAFLIQGPQLAAYLAGRDALIDAGEVQGTTSQPQRPSFADVVSMSPSDRQAFEQTIVGGLASFASAMTGIQANVKALGLDANDPWISEIEDGIAVDIARTQFIGALYQAAAAFADTGSDGGALAQADAALAAGQAAIAHRHANLHYPRPDALLQKSSNDTIYQYGYLYEAESLCYWNRERGQARNLIFGGDEGGSGVRVELRVGVAERGF